MIFLFSDSRSKTACRATPASAASSTLAAYRARRFPKSPLTHFAASPLRKRSRSVRLLGCKRPCDGSLSLPTFCEKKEGASRGWRSGRKNRGKAKPEDFFGHRKRSKESEGFPAISSSNLSSATKRNSNVDRRCCFFFDFRITSNYIWQLF